MNIYQSFNVLISPHVIQYHVSAALRLVTEASVPEAVTMLSRLRIHAPHVREIAAICGIEAEKLGEIANFDSRRDDLSLFLLLIFVFFSNSSYSASPRYTRSFL